MTEMRAIPVVKEYNLVSNPVAFASNGKYRMIN